MNTVKETFGSIMTMGALVLTFAPGVFAATDVSVEVSGNGAGSTQEVVVKEKSSDVVYQSTVTEVVNVQSANSSTGGNTIKGSTGSGSEHGITTGDAYAKNTATVHGGSNTVVSHDCGCVPSEVVVDVKENGTNAKTKVKVIKQSNKKTKQQSATVVLNEQDAKAKTGGNKIKNSTGTDGDTITTGNATTKNKLVVQSGNNFVGPVEVL